MWPLRYALSGYCGVAPTGNGLSPQARAQQLAEVAVAVYEAGGSAIHLPLESSNPLLAIVKQALAQEDSQHAVGQTLAKALLESVLQAEDAESESDSLPPLMVRLNCNTCCLPSGGPVFTAAPACNHTGVLHTLIYLVFSAAPACNHTGVFHTLIYLIYSPHHVAAVAVCIRSVLAFGNQKATIAL